MQQRQLRLGDILDDYCPRERRISNHAVVAMVGPEVKQTRCTTCDFEHVYKHAKVPRQRRKTDTPALYSQVLAGAPKKVVHEPPRIEEGSENPLVETPEAPNAAASPAEAVQAGSQEPEQPERPENDEDDSGPLEEGPVHRPLIRAQLPRLEGQPPPMRPAPEFTIRQPGGGRPGRFRPRHLRGGTPSFPSSGNRHGNMPGGGMPRHGGQPPMMSRSGKRHGPPGHKRSK